jgi:alpha-L-fucosidase
VPEWFRDAKIGIFIHWGLYSVPAYGDEWYCRHMYMGTDYWAVSQGFDKGAPTIQQYHMDTYGKEFGYKNFIDIWNVDRFDADEWADLFTKAGAKYVMPVGIHHDAFALYDSSITPWNTVNKGIGTSNHRWDTENGHGRDYILELQKAVKKRKLYFGVSDHLAENCTWVPHLKEYDTDISRMDTDPHRLREFYGSDYTNEEEAERWLECTEEIVDRFHPDLMYFDMALKENKFDDVKRQYAAYYYNDANGHNPDGVGFFYKKNIFEEREAILDIERGQLKEIRELPWQTDTSISAKSWGYIENDVYRDASYFIASLIDVVSKNGNLLINIPPKADGSIPEEVKNILLQIGSWLEKNGEAIYSTRPYKIYGEGPTIPGGYYSDNDLRFTEEDIRFTTSKDGKYLYILSMTGIHSEKLIIHSLQGMNSENTFHLVETGENVTGKMTASGIELDFSGIDKEMIQRPFAVRTLMKSGE